MYTNVDHFNAFDNGMTLWINGAQLPASPVMAVTHHSLVSGPTNIAGLRVYVKYYGLPGSNTLRTLVSFINLGGSAVPVTATVASNLGTDAFTVIPGTSSGNNAFDTTDRWVVTSDSLTNPGEIVDTHVLFGPGAPPVTPNLAATSSLAAATWQPKRRPPTPTASAHALYSVCRAFPPAICCSSTRLMTAPGALADAADFNHEPVDMLDGLSNAELADTVNWKLLPVLRTFLPLLRR